MKKKKLMNSTNINHARLKKRSAFEQSRKIESWLDSPKGAKGSLKCKLII